MTGLLGPPTRLWPEPVRPAALDGPVPDVGFDLDAGFVVDWQVAEYPADLVASPDFSEFELLFP